jgi:D-serine deaminase-like pyridoxal phosphate-dependent protein
MKDWYRISNIDEVDTPALVIYPDRVKKNIELLKSMINDVNRLRPHVKTNKAKEAALLMIEAGIKKFKCATIAEAEMLGLAKAPDVLLAYQPIGPKVQRFISLVQQYPSTKYSCLVDNSSAAEEIGKKAGEAGIVVPVFIDLNVGMNRTGIVPGQKAIDLFIRCSTIKGIKPVGLHVYDGHITDIEFEVREKRSNEAFAAVEWMQGELEKKGFKDIIIVAGGSPSFTVHAKRAKVECSPGTFIYWDAGYVQKYKEQPFLPAALVISRVISLPNETTICADLGHKSVASENPLPDRVSLINAPELSFTGQSEEHLVLQGNKDHGYKTGDVLYGIPVHICPTCALYERALIVEDGKVTGEWKIVARDRKIRV